MKYTCLIFSEGGSDRKFLRSLIPLLEEYHAKKWSFNYDNASGGSPEAILKKCENIPFVNDYKLVLCFIDLDKLKTDFQPTWEKEKEELENRYNRFKIIWQLDSLEDEIKKVIGDLDCGKYRLNQVARRKVAQFKNSNYWKRILEPIKSKEVELERDEAV